jgi:hypothetical protein
MRSQNKLNDYGRREAKNNIKGTKAKYCNLDEDMWTRHQALLKNYGPSKMRKEELSYLD